MKHYGAIEAGGTKFVCAVGSRKRNRYAEPFFQLGNKRVPLPG